MDINARREAAKALRAIKRGGEGWFSLSDAVLGRPAPRDEVVARLADLIDPGEYTTVSAYDLLSEGDREALEWMRNLYGVENAKIRLDHLDHENDELSDENDFLCDSLNRVCEVLGLPDADRFGSNDGYGSVRADMLNELRKRLMPEGVEWPRYNTSELVLIGDDVIGPDHGESIHVDEITFHANGFTLRSKTGLDHWYENDDRFERPVVLSADGEPLEAGQTVYVIANGKTHHVTEVDTVSKRFRSMEQVDGSHWLDPMCFTHQRPALDADGVPCKEGDTVYALCDGSEHVVECVNENGTLKSAKPNSACYLVASRCTHTKPVIGADGLLINKGDTVYWLEHTGAFTVVSPHETHDNAGHELTCGHTVEIAREGHEPHMYVHPESLSHTKPEQDTWERIEEDAKSLRESIAMHLGDYEFDCETNESVQTRIIDLVRRCKALAEKGSE